MNKAKILVRSNRPDEADQIYYRVFDAHLDSAKRELDILVGYRSKPSLTGIEGSRPRRSRSGRSGSYVGRLYKGTA